jgi:hypothetical protein
MRFFTNEVTGEMHMKKRKARKRVEDTKESQYLEGLKKYRDQGIPIIIDGKESPEEDWNKIFKVKEEDCFYMADYVPNETTGKLKEIRFDKIYNR